MRGGTVPSLRPMVRRPSRVCAGVTLLEVLVALPIMAILMSASSLLLFATLRGLEGRMHAIRTHAEIRRGAVLTRRALAPLRARDLRAVSDSQLEIAEHLTIGILCASVSHTQLVVAWPSAPPGGDGIRSGDLLEFWPRGLDAGTLAPPVERAVRGVASHTGRDALSATCVTGIVSRSIVTVDSIPGALVVGAPVLVRRRQRWLHYRSASAWWIGRRSFDGRQWDGTQPVVGPVNSPHDGGMFVMAWRRDGAAPDQPDSTIILDVTIRRTIPDGGVSSTTSRMPLSGNESSAERPTPDGWSRNVP